MLGKIMTVWLEEGDVFDTKSQAEAEILSRLVKIENNMARKNMFLTTKKQQLLQESFKNEKEGKLISGEELKKQI